jgi:hypothetical protein
VDDTSPWAVISLGFEDDFYDKLWVLIDDELGRGRMTTTTMIGLLELAKTRVTDRCRTPVAYYDDDDFDDDLEEDL